ncbi:hypothetical protein RUND412_008648 [Rhizina undulata]
MIISSVKGIGTSIKIDIAWVMPMCVAEPQLDVAQEHHGLSLDWYVNMLYVRTSLRYCGEAHLQTFLQIDSLFMPSYADYDIEQLAELCSFRGISVRGLRVRLVRRLEEDDRKYKLPFFGWESIDYKFPDIYEDEVSPDELVAVEDAKNIAEIGIIGVVDTEKGIQVGEEISKVVEEPGEADHTVEVSGVVVEEHREAGEKVDDHGRDLHRDATSIAGPIVEIQVDVEMTVMDDKHVEEVKAVLGANDCFCDNTANESREGDIVMSSISSATTAIPTTTNVTDANNIAEVTNISNVAGNIDTTVIPDVNMTEITEIANGNETAKTTIIAGDIDISGGTQTAKSIEAASIANATEMAETAGISGLMEAAKWTEAASVTDTYEIAEEGEIIETTEAADIANASEIVKTTEAARIANISEIFEAAGIFGATGTAKTTEAADSAKVTEITETTGIFVATETVKTTEAANIASRTAISGATDINADVPTTINAATQELTIFNTDIALGNSTSIFPHKGTPNFQNKDIPTGPRADRFHNKVYEPRHPHGASGNIVVFTYSHGGDPSNHSHRMRTRSPPRFGRHWGESYASSSKVIDSYRTHAPDCRETHDRGDRSRESASKEYVDPRERASREFREARQARHARGDIQREERLERERERIARERAEREEREREAQRALEARESRDRYRRDNLRRSKYDRKPAGFHRGSEIRSNKDSGAVNGFGRSDRHGNESERDGGYRRDENEHEGVRIRGRASGFRRRYAIFDVVHFLSFA